MPSGRRIWTWLLAILGGGLLLGLAVVLGINLVLVQRGRERIRTVEEITAMAEAGTLNADCILVLGCRVWEDGRPSDMLEDRLKQGITLYEADGAPVLLMSGDHGREDYDEVTAMKRYAAEAGVPSEDIFLDHAGFSTYDSLWRAKEIFGAERVVIVTQEYHLYRALYLAEELGLEAVGVSADLRSYAGQSFRELREILARLKDFVLGIWQPDAVGGEPIALSGDGNVTN